MNAQAVTLHFPLPLYDRLRRRAAETHRSVEDEILEVVAQGVPSTEDEISPELTAAISALQGLDDRALWTAAKDRFPEEATERFQALNLKQQRDGLTEAELEELEELRHGYERVVLVRAEAAYLLKERGHDVSELLGNG